jgi:tetratricopeptide (TPR) repeat protein
MIDLAEGLLQQGSFDAATETLAEVRSIAAVTGEERLAVRADLVQAWVEQFRGGSEGGSARAFEAATRAIAALGPMHDAAGLARAWRLLMVTHVLQGHLEEAAAAADQVVEHARQAGDSRLSARSAGTIAWILLQGPTPVSEAIPQLEALIASVEADRTAEAVLVGSLAVLRAMDGDFDGARDLYRRGEAIAAELGSGLVGSSSSIDSSRVELLAGDLAAAERDLRRDYDALAEINETYFRSSIAAFLANVLWLAGDDEGALHFSQVAEELGDVDDVSTQVPWRSARARVLAARGEAVDARRLATEAVELAAGTPQPHLRAKALADLADVLITLGDVDSAEPRLREALALYEQKGDLVSAAHLRERLSVAEVS